jgi:hypothetical protein
MKRVLFKIILPSMLLAFWIMTCYSICNKPEGLDLFELWIFVGFPYGIRKMSMFLIPSGYGIAGSIGVFALNAIIGGMIGGIVVVFKILGIVLEVFKIIFEFVLEKNGRLIRIQSHEV